MTIDARQEAYYLIHVGRADSQDPERFREELQWSGSPLVAPGFHNDLHAVTLCQGPRVYSRSSSSGFPRKESEIAPL